MDAGLRDMWRRNSAGRRSGFGPLLVSGFPKPTRLQKHFLFGKRKKYRYQCVNPGAFVDVHIPFLQDGVLDITPRGDAPRKPSENHFGFGWFCWLPLDLFKVVFYRFYHGIHHHFSPPFGRICLELFPSVEEANPRYEYMTMWWFQICFYVHPYFWGRWPHFDEHFFQRGCLKPPTRWYVQLLIRSCILFKQSL